jgi:uncharacterized protein YjbI with pentapeptide repeats
VTFTDCRADLTSLRFSSLQDVSFVDCILAQADFTGVDLRGTHFTGCDLTAAQFAQANCAGTRFTRCELGGIGSVERLRGATVDAADLAGLAHALAAALGITIDPG